MVEEINVEGFVYINLQSRKVIELPYHVFPISHLDEEARFGFQ